MQMPTRAISQSRDLPKLACFLAGDTRDIATHVFVVGPAKIGRFYRHEIFAFASACNYKLFVVKQYSVFNVVLIGIIYFLVELIPELAKYTLHLCSG